MVATSRLHELPKWGNLLATRASGEASSADLEPQLPMPGTRPRSCHPQALSTVYYQLDVPTRGRDCQFSENSISTHSYSNFSLTKGHSLDRLCAGHRRQPPPAIGGGRQATLQLMSLSRALLFVRTAFKKRRVAFISRVNGRLDTLLPSLRLCASKMSTIPTSPLQSDPYLEADTKDTRMTRLNSHFHCGIPIPIDVLFS
ncbi:unnamed protein product [Protopolystoma xenopodis]|uniref:Uncharacterized protein n=1 Tax=Protopolystoma xenopodis TaxID=117903 RepID=A0A3S5CSW0_9PLAT|nr:unnamed protein product [Protopolystoma xenopodis]